MSQQNKSCFTCGNKPALHSGVLIDKILFKRDLHGSLAFCKEHFKATMKDIEDSMKATGYVKGGIT